MFLQKDAFDDDDGSWAPPASTASTRQPASGLGSGSRPGTSSGRPTSSGGFGGGAPASGAGGSRPMTGSSAAGGEEEGEVATPGSVTNMRAKMLQQRERLLAKQRSGGMGGSMVMANQGIPASSGAGNPTPSPSGMPRPGASPFGGSSVSSPGSGGFGASGPFGMKPGSSAGDGPNFGRQNSDITEAGHDEDAGQGAVMPMASTPLSKEEEEARRAALKQQLNERGMSAEYDPSGGALCDKKSDFDIASIKPGDMRAFLHSPVPEGAGTIQCRVVRERTGISTKLHPKYSMESDNGIFMMTAQKQVKNKTSNYAVSMSRGSTSKESEGFIGKLRSDFLGIEWVAYGPGVNPAKVDPKLPPASALQMVREELVAIQYTASKWGPSAKGPRKMNVVLPKVQANSERLICRTISPHTEGLLALYKSQSPSATPLIESYCNKPPVWNEQIGAYVLNFNKRVTEASVKNFQLVSSSDPKIVYLQFGRVGKDAFNLDFRWPISPFQAFAMCLSSFDYKLGCE